MEALVMTAQLILGLSILVGLHELGHLLAAKAFGMKVEQFSIGFPPKIFGVKYGETEYSVGAIPLGGFVKITGMIDESLDTEHLNEEPQPYEFRAKPAWQRLIVMIGGILVNVILGIVIFIGLKYAYGETYIPKEEVTRLGIVARDLGQEIGLQTGDKILKVNGQDYERFSDITGADVLLEKGSFYTIERNGEIMDIPVPGNLIDRLGDKNVDGFIDVAIPFRIGRVEKGSNADKAGLKTGDNIVSVNGKETPYFQSFQQAIQENKGQEVVLKVERGGEMLTINANVTEEGTLGFYPEQLLNLASIDYSLGESITKGTSEAFQSAWVNIRGVGKLFSGEVSFSSMKGPMGIAQIYSGTWDWRRFWVITGVLSMWLAFVNFLPIPALDGGHVAFLSYEIVSGRKPSDSFLETSQKVGMVLLLTLMAAVIFNDVFQTFFN